MERMTVEQRDGLFCGVVQSLRGSTWRTVFVMAETASQSAQDAARATIAASADCGCPFVPAGVAVLELAA